MYTERELVQVARRENNTRRNYLVVNRLQAKHVPVSPGQTMAMFDRLAELLREKYGQEELLLLGFAETATAIGARLAIKLGAYYIQTTRETEAGRDYLYFTESHSHATEQKLMKGEIDRLADGKHRIIFVEDEVTTGNTIMKLIRILREKYRRQFSFSVASILNGMGSEDMEKYKREGIPVHYLVKTDHSGYGERADSFLGDGIYHTKQNGEGTGWESVISGRIRPLDGYVNTRHLVEGRIYEEACEVLANRIGEDLGDVREQRILVLGTEEFMYPAIHTAYWLEKKGNEVKCHATTRSPVEVSREKEYPLHERYELTSFYDSRRATFLYDIGQYDRVIILTDSVSPVNAGAGMLFGALQECGNTDILCYQWCGLPV